MPDPAENPAPDQSEKARKERRGMRLGCALIFAIMLLWNVKLPWPWQTDDDSKHASPLYSATQHSDARYIAAAKELVRLRLRDPDSAVFSDLQVVPERADSVTAVCGVVRSRNGFGGMTPRQRFIAANDTVLEEQVGREIMDRLWSRIC